MDKSRRVWKPIDAFKDERSLIVHGMTMSMVTGINCVLIYLFIYSPFSSRRPQKKKIIIGAREVKILGGRVVEGLFSFRFFFFFFFAGFVLEMSPKCVNNMGKKKIE